MAGKKIKGLTVEIGGDTTKLGKALDGVEKQSKDLSSELGEINRLLKLDPKNTELLAQKQKVLAEAITTTSKKLDTLKEAERQVQQQFERGEVSEEQVRALQREIVATEKKLEGYKKAVKETTEQTENLGKETEETGSSMDGLGKGLGVITALVAAAGAAVIGLTEETREYRREIGKLETGFQDAGHSTEAATKTYKALQGVLGETDRAVEAANHLAMLAGNEEALEELTHALTGVYAKFVASLPIESLAEAANETAKVGKVTGNFADAINWATKETTDWEGILGKGSAQLQAFNKAIEEGEAIEDAYTAALEACNNEQERQQLITKTLTKLYKGAADQYKITNKEIIRANEANEAWTATLAGLGEEMEPVLTDIKQMGTSLAKDLEKPLKSAVGWVRDKFLPALSKLGNWVKQNGPIIKATTIGVTAAIIAYKAAVVAAEIAQKGLKAALMATKVAQDLLNASQAATPWGLIAVAVTAVVTAVVALGRSTEEAAYGVDVLTEEEKKLIETAEEAAEAFDELKASTDKALADNTAQFGYTQKLADELRGLADASGEVQQKDQERVNFILSELNNALGTEYTMVDGIIQKYGDLKISIDQVIQSKLADALLETANAGYVAAVQEKNAAMGRVVATEKEYQAQKEKTRQVEADYQSYLEEYKRAEANIRTEADAVIVESMLYTLGQKENDWKAEQEILADKEEKFHEAVGKYGEYVTTINTFEEAQTAVLAGNTQTAVDLLSKKSGAYADYSDKVDQETKKVLDTLYQEAIDAGIEADRIKTNFENGVEGYTEEMVKEAEQSYQDAMSNFATAYADAEGVGKDLGSGMKAGMESERSGLINKAKSMVKSIISAFRQEADSHSPSRKMIAFGEDMGEGAKIGLDEKTGDILKTAKHQVQAMLEVYNGNDNSAAVQQSLTAVESRHQAQAAKAAASNAAQLDKILAAIEHGHILTIDSKALVGATAGAMDNTLGQRRVLAARGAL